MSVRLKPVEQQVIVLTGATSGIGLATAHALADRGARLVLVSRNAEALEEVADECRERGGEAVTVAADVGSHDDLERVARTAIERFGGFDTWINNAGVAIYGTCEEVPLEDHRRLFETNYWGVVHGSLIAASHLRGKGGKIINTGSVLGDRAMILQGPYSASKHAVDGFTDALRMDLETGDTPISVTQIKPSAIDTPYMEHARSYLGGNEKPATILCSRVGGEGHSLRLRQPSARPRRWVRRLGCRRLGSRGAPSNGLSDGGNGLRAPGKPSSR
jgi:NAD(P)-dependent dehydrogenase (short-subunit alcohol dehydrogenase family)